MAHNLIISRDIDSFNPNARRIALADIARDLIPGTPAHGILPLNSFSVLRVEHLHVIKLYEYQA